MSGPDGSDAAWAGPGSPSHTQRDCPALAHPAKRKAERRDAYEDSLRLLEAKARTTSELRQRLARRGYAPADVDRAVGRLLGVGLLDDVAYAEQFVR
jgi:regulatory protein